MTPTANLRRRIDQVIAILCITFLCYAQSVSALHIDALDNHDLCWICQVASDNDKSHFPYGMGIDRRKGETEKCAVPYSYGICSRSPVIWHTRDPPIV